MIRLRMSGVGRASEYALYIQSRTGWVEPVTAAQWDRIERGGEILTSALCTRRLGPILRRRNVSCRSTERAYSYSSPFNRPRVCSSHSKSEQCKMTYQTLAVLSAARSCPGGFKRSNQHPFFATSSHITQILSPDRCWLGSTQLTSVMPWKRIGSWPGPAA